MLFDDFYLDMAQRIRWFTNHVVKLSPIYVLTDLLLLNFLGLDGTGDVNKI